MELVADTPKLPSGERGIWVRRFVLSAGVILAFTGLAKIISAVGNAQALETPDPVFWLSFRYLMLGVGILELTISGVCMSPGRNALRLKLIAWMGVSFMIYRSGVWLSGWHRPCPCLGTLTDSLHISTKLADTVMISLLGYLLVGSFACLCLETRTSRKNSA